MFENLQKTILSLYDYTGTFADLYRQAGYNVVQIDLAFNGKDVRLLEKLNANVYGIIAMPPCTKLSKAGAQYERTVEEMIEALSCVDVVYRLVYLYKPVFWVLENPPGKLRKYIGDPEMIVRYQDCGADISKEACLWGKFNFPKLPKTRVYCPGVDRIYGGREDGKRARSATPIEFARVFFDYNR